MVGRLLQLPATVAAIVVAAFVLIHVAPGDPVLALAGDSGDAAYYARIRDKFGLDEPLARQLATYAGRVARGDLGTSYVHGRPVVELIGERLPATVLLTATALLASTLIGVGLGTVGGARAGGALDAFLNATTLGLFAAPVFWLGQLSILLGALWLGWFPVQGMTSARSSAEGLSAVLDVLRHLALPAAVLASHEIAAVSRTTRAGVAEELRTDHVRTARAKGVPPRWVVLRHGLRRPLLPVVTVVGARLGHLAAGTVVVETVFGWPGIGRLLLSSVQARDVPVVLGIFLVVAVSVVVGNLVTDLTYARLDPRIRHG